MPYKLLPLTVLIALVSAWNTSSATVTDHLSRKDSAKYANKTLTDEMLNTEITYEIIGVNDELKDNIEAYLSTLPAIKRVNYRARRTQIFDSVKEAISAFGYYNPKITAQFMDNKPATLMIHVDAGKPVYLRRVEIAVLGEALTDPIYMMLFRNQTLVPYTQLKHTDYESLKSTMMSRALTRGYFDAHFIESKIYVDVDNNCADVRLVLNSGRAYHYSEIKVTGDTQYSQLVQPLITIKPQEQFNMNRISAVSSDLYATSYFSSAEITPNIEEAQGNQLPISINLKRNSFNIVEVGAGYSTDEEFRGHIDWTMPLINKYGHSLQLQVKASQIQQELMAKYTIPRKHPLKDYYYLMALQTYEDLNDTDSMITSGQAHYVAKQTGSWMRDYGIIAQYEDYTQGQEKGNGYVWGPSISIKNMRAFPRTDPRNGTLYNVRVFTTAKAMGSDETFTQLYGVAKWIRSPTRDSRFVARFEQGVNIGNNVEHLPPSFRFFTGGDSTIRGYSYKELSSTDADGYLIGGRYLTVGSLEIQIPIIDKLRNNWFIDAGTATNDYDYHDDRHIGVGTGVRYVSPIGLIRFDVGFGVSETHIPFHVHFGIGPDI